MTTATDLTRNSSDSEFRAVYESGINGVQIAEITGLTTNTVYSRIRRAGGTIRRKGGHAKEKPAGVNGTTDIPRRGRDGDIPRMDRRRTLEGGMTPPAIARHRPLVTAHQAADQAGLAGEATNAAPATRTDDAATPEIPPVLTELAFAEPSTPNTSDHPANHFSINRENGDGGGLENPVQQEIATATTPPAVCDPFPPEPPEAISEDVRIELVTGEAPDQFSLALTRHDENASVSSLSAMSVVRAWLAAQDEIASGQAWVRVIPHDADPWEVAEACASAPPRAAYQLSVHVSITRAP